MYRFGLFLILSSILVYATYSCISKNDTIKDNGLNAPSLAGTYGEIGDSLPTIVNARIDNVLKVESNLAFEDIFDDFNSITQDTTNIPFGTFIYDSNWRSNVFYLAVSNLKFTNNGKDPIWIAKTSESDLDSIINLYAYYKREHDRKYKALEFLNERYFVADRHLKDINTRRIEIVNDLQNKISYLNKILGRMPDRASLLGNWRDFFIYENVANNLSGIRYKINIMPKNYFNEIDTLKALFGRDELIFNTAYRHAVWNYSYLITYKENKYVKPSIEQHYDVINTFFAGKTREFLLFKILKNTNFTKGERQREKFDKFILNSIVPEYIVYLNNIDKYSASTLKGENIIDFNGNKVEFTEILKDARLNYIDFWASWCKPCIEEFPYSKALKVNLEDSKLRVLYFSIDQNFDVWRKSLIRLGLPPNDCFWIPNSNSSAIIKEFKISAIPRYLLLDSLGGVLHDNFKRPSDSSTVSMLNEILKSIPE